MKYSLLAPHPPGSAEWKEQRRTGVGSSDAPVLCIGEWFGRSPLHVWLEKRHGHDQAVNQSMRMGSVMEETIARLAAEEEGWELRTIPTIRCNDYPWRIASIDRVITDLEIPLEIKKARSDRGWGRGRDEVPVGYFVQVQHQMDVFGADRCMVVVLIAGEELRTYEVAADPRIQARIREIEETFWGCVTGGTLPEIKADVGDLLDRYFPPAAGGRDATDAEAALAARYAAAALAVTEAGRAYRKAEKVKKALAAELKAAMGCTVLTLPTGGSVTQRPAGGKRAGKFDLKLEGVHADEEDDDGEE